MEDKEIVALYWTRDERAIQETQRRYDRLLASIAFRVLSDREDSRECVNDTYYRAWEIIPPHRPSALPPFLSRIVRGLAIDRYRRQGAQKRAPAEYTLSLEELGDCVSGQESPQQAMEWQALGLAIGDYLRQEPLPARQAFLWRYFYFDTLKEIAVRQSSTVSQVKSMLYRTRQGLRQYLEKEGFDV